LTRAAGTLEVYVWFEADPAHDAAVRQSFLQLVQRMTRQGPDAAAGPGAPRLLRRTDLRARPEGLRATWMEVWSGVPASGVAPWLAAMEAAAAATGSTGWACGGRHVEVFAPDAGG
jgi:hypothetical protein